VVRCARHSVEVLREGTLDRVQLLRTAAATVLFVCTGNTCRSPLAAAMARRRAADQLGIAEDDLLPRGVRIASAGTMVNVAVPASEGAVAAAAEVGLDLSGHRSRPVDAELVGGVVSVYALARSHLDTLLRNHPRLGAMAELLDPDDRDILDPFGGELALYRETRDAIGAALERRWPAIEAWL
jgi:protein-tyrosine phosphatase